METQIVIGNNEVINILSCSFVAIKQSIFWFYPFNTLGAFTFYKGKPFYICKFKRKQRKQILNNDIPNEVFVNEFLIKVKK